MHRFLIKCFINSNNRSLSTFPISLYFVLLALFTLYGLVNKYILSDLNIQLCYDVWNTLLQNYPGRGCSAKNLYPCQVANAKPPPLVAQTLPKPTITGTKFRPKSIPLVAHCLKILPFVALKVANGSTPPPWENYPCRQAVPTCTTLPTPPMQVECSTVFPLN